MNLLAAAGKTRRFETGIVCLILLFALGVRLYALYSTHIVNQDGTGYIYQAQAVYHGQWQAINDCSVPFLSSYPFLIAAAYPVFGDWLAAARSVSILFGWLFLVPLYGLCRRFFDFRTSAFVLLLYALMPVFVGRSADVVRDPIFWALATAGLYLFLRSVESDRWPPALMAGALFLAAVTARIEAAVYLMVSAGFILFAGGKNRWGRLFSLLLPTLLVAALLLLLSTQGGLFKNAFSRIDEIGQKIVAPVAHYGGLQNSLAELVHRTDIPLETRLFIHMAKNTIWLVGVGAVFVYALESFFFAYVPFFLAGLVHSIRRPARAEKQRVYFFLLAAAGGVALTAHVLDVWILENRFFALVILPSFLFAGTGLERTAAFFQKRLGWKPAMVWLAAGIFIAASALSIDLRDREPEKAVFAEIGRRIAAENQTKAPASVSAPSPLQGWIAFYANRSTPGPFCALDLDKCWDLWQETADADAFLDMLEQEQIRYLLWTERFWPGERFDPGKGRYADRFRELGRWRQPEAGEMILYEVRRKDRGRAGGCIR